jgi:hypothetical protein
LSTDEAHRHGPTAESASSRRLRILETNYGREPGWYVQRGTRRIALLVDPQPVDMFIDSYRTEPLPDDSGPALDLESSSFWTDEPLTFISREFGDVAANAIPLSYRAGDAPRLEIRGLYLDVPPPTPWDALRLLWHRRTSRLRSGGCGRQQPHQRSHANKQASSEAAHRPAESTTSQGVTCSRWPSHEPSTPIRRLCSSRTVLKPSASASTASIAGAESPWSMTSPFREPRSRISCSASREDRRC